TVSRSRIASTANRVVTSRGALNRPGPLGSAADAPLRAGSCRFPLATTPNPSPCADSPQVELRRLPETCHGVSPAKSIDPQKLPIDWRGSDSRPSDGRLAGQFEDVLGELRRAGDPLQFGLHQRPEVGPVAPPAAQRL